MNNQKFFPRIGIASLLACLMILSVACAPAAKESAEPPSGLSTSKHDLRGIVVSVNAEAKEAIVDHEEIPDLMGAMRMGFSVPAEADLQKLQPGAKINAKLVMENNTMWLEAVEVTGQGEVPEAEASGGSHAH